MFVEPTLSNVTIFAGNFAPRGWMFCQGQLLQISSYDALFALIGTTYGGDGQVTFALPDLRSRVAVHTGQGPGLATYILGQMAGTENINVLQNNLPVHTHQFVSITAALPASVNAGTLDNPTAGVAALTTGINTYNTAGTSAMKPTVNNVQSGIAGSSLPMNNLSPVLAMNYIIAVEGIFPSRN